MSNEDLREEEEAYSRKELCELIPNFDGDNIPLHQFIDTVDFVFAKAKTIDNPYLLRILLNRLSGRAGRIILARHYSDWENIKKALTTNFGLERSAEGLISDLIRFKCGNKSSIKDTYNKIAKIRDDLTAAAIENINVECDPIDVLSDFIDKIAKTTFLNNVPKDVEISIAHTKAESLEVAFSHALNAHKRLKEREDQEKFSEFKSNKIFTQSKFIPKQQLNIKTENKPRPSTSFETTKKPTNAPQTESRQRYSFQGSPFRGFPPRSPKVNTCEIQSHPEVDTFENTNDSDCEQENLNLELNETEEGCSFN